jgi:hypothetical protein
MIDRGVLVQWLLTANLLFKIAPRDIGPAIGADDPGRGAGVHPAIERLVAFAQLLPFEPLEAALVLYGDQLLGDELLAPFAIDPCRQMDGAGRIK